jgi:hypothetical protein
LEVGPRDRFVRVEPKDFLTQRRLHAVNRNGWPRSHHSTGLVESRNRPAH